MDATTQVIILAFILALSAAYFAFALWRSRVIRAMLHVLPREKSKRLFRLHSLGYVRKFYWVMFVGTNILALLIYFVYIA